MDDLTIVTLTNCLLRRSDIFISDHFLFPDTVVGKSSIIKIPIKNKGKSPQTVSQNPPCTLVTYANNKFAIMLGSRLPSLYF